MLSWESLEHHMAESLHFERVEAGDVKLFVQQQRSVLENQQLYLGTISADNSYEVHPSQYLEDCLVFVSSYEETSLYALIWKRLN